jgi:hypothetical protein
MASAGIFFRVTFSTNSAAPAVVFRSSFTVANGFLSGMAINLANFFENTTGGGLSVSF